MAGHIIHLIGFPGVGKLTVANAMVRLKPDVVVVDNHLINNPLFSVLGYDGITPLPTAIWAKVADMRAIVLEVIRTFSPERMTFVFTNVMIDDAEDATECRKIEQTAIDRGGQYYPILMTCDIEENCRRIASEERASRLKATDPTLPRRMHDGVGLIRSYDDHPNCLRIDVTSSGPMDAAVRILSKVFPEVSSEQEA